MPYDPNDERYREHHVTPRYLAGSSGIGDPGFAPVAHWPHRHLWDGPCQFLVTSPDARIRIGWFGDDFELWRISAAEDPLAPPQWSATFNHTTPPEIVAGLTRALAQDYDDGDDRFLEQPSRYWADAVRPLTEAGWTRDGGAEIGTVELIAPDDQAGMLIDNRRHVGSGEKTQLWSGPLGWGTRTEAIFTTRTPAHLIAATAAAWVDPTPVVRERHMIHRKVEHLVHLTPLAPDAPAGPRLPTPLGLPTPLDVRRTAVTAAVSRATRDQHADLRVHAAHSRTTARVPRGRTPQAAATTAASPARSAPSRTR